MTWHADTPSLVAYAAGQLNDAGSASVEAHVMACGSCREALADLADHRRLDTSWAAIEARVDEPSRSVLERLLRRVGVSEGQARLIAVTPSLRLDLRGRRGPGPHCRGLLLRRG